MTTAQRPPALRGRSSEREALDRLLADARNGQSGVLVIRGVAGVGKTELMRHVAEHATGFRVAQITGVESERELPFAALHQLCAPLLDRLDALPAPQQDALRVALGLAAGDVPDRFLVGLAALTLLAEVAEERPLLCVVDDAHWLDEATVQALGFVARRLLAEPIAIVFAVREPSDERQLAGLPELRLEGLGHDDALALLATVVPGRLDARVRDRIIAETRGNPLLLLELSRGMSEAELAGGFGRPILPKLAGTPEDWILRRVEPLPAETRRLMQLAAADPVGEPLLVWRAAEQLGIAPQAAEPAVDAGLFEIGAQVRFQHPCVRSAVYRSASPEERHALHAALAQATDPELDPDRRAWHLAQATPGTDEQVAEELERSADRALARGGIAAAAAFFDNAATLTPDPRRRVQRLIVAARTLRDAGQLDGALERLSAAEAGPAGEREVAEIDHLRGQIAFDQRRMGDAARLLLSAALRAERASARTRHLEAIGAAMWAGDLDNPTGLLEAAEATREAPPAIGPPGAADLLLDGLALRVTDGYTAAAPVLRRAVDTVLELTPVAGEIGQWLWLAGSRGAGAVAFELWDAEAAHTLAGRQVQVARDAGALVQLQFALNFLSRTYILGGDLAAAAAANEEERKIAEATRRPAISYTEMMLAAWQGREAPAAETIARERAHAAAHGQGRIVNFADYAAAVLYNGVGRYDAALDAARRAFERDLISYRAFVLPELAEAAARGGEAALLRAALEQVSECARVTPTDWVLAIEARVRALATEGAAAEPLYRESIERLARTRLRAELARSQLLYGEWLRREGRRVDARQALRVARETLLAIGAEGFADRARHELLATGEKVRKRSEDARDELTPQEEHIARLARDGRTNPEIAAELFLSPRTVEWHLKKVFSKLGITSRRALRDALPRDREPVPA